MASYKLQTWNPLSPIWASSSVFRKRQATGFEPRLRQKTNLSIVLFLAAHSDYFYCGQRSANSPGRPEQYSKKARDIKEELERVSRSNRQIVRTEPAGEAYEIFIVCGSV